MKIQSIKQELAQHVLDLINDGAINADNLEDAHFHAFNEDYYIVGYYQAEQWLENHDVSAWEAIAYVMCQEEEQLGEIQLKYGDINAERIVNLYVYYTGFELDIYHEELEDLKEAMEAIIANINLRGYKTNENTIN